MSRPSRPSRWRAAELHAACAVLVALAAGLVFWIPGFRRAGRHFPVPLDDTFIHFDFARSAALGRPFHWMPDAGFSSGDTSLTYPLVLAPGWLVGFRGEGLSFFAAAIALASLADLSRSLFALRLGWVGWVAPFVLVCVPLLDWSLFSGMETAFLAAVIGRALLAVRRVELSDPASRARAQSRAGLWIALLPATRPELAPLALLLALAAAHASGSLSVAVAALRCFTPALGFLALEALANRAFTGEWAAAGAIRKLLTANPFTTRSEVAIEALKNLATLRSQAFEAPLGGRRLAWMAVGLCALAAIDRRSRRLGLPLAVGAIASLLLVCLNGTARFQNFRYAAPALLLLLVGAVIGAAALARRSALLAALAIATLVVAPLRGFPRQIDHFARASANIAQQQMEVARRLATRWPGANRVLVGDAGAIPYFSGLPALDGLGLGGFRGLPFARASVEGVPAVIELIERLPEADRPDVMALYPSWWPGLADVFGRRIDAVRIDDNVICGSDEKVIYAADWSALAPRSDARAGAIDELDVADLVDERAHEYEAPFPSGGFVLGGVHTLPSGARRFDGGRLLPEGLAESFRLAAGGPDLVLVVRTDGEGDATARVEIGGATRGLVVVPPTSDAASWRDVVVPLGAASPGDRVRIVTDRGALRDFHLWILSASDLVP